MWFQQFEPSRGVGDSGHHQIRHGSASSSSSSSTWLRYHDYTDVLGADADAASSTAYVTSINEKEGLPGSYIDLNGHHDEELDRIRRAAFASRIALYENNDLCENHTGDEAVFLLDAAVAEEEDGEDGSGGDHVLRRAWSLVSRDSVTHVRKLSFVGNIERHLQSLLLQHCEETAATKAVAWKSVDEMTTHMSIHCGLLMYGSRPQSHPDGRQLTKYIFTTNETDLEPCSLVDVVVCVALLVATGDDDDNDDDDKVSLYTLHSFFFLIYPQNHIPPGLVSRPSSSSSSSSSSDVTAASAALVAAVASDA